MKTQNLDAIITGIRDEHITPAVSDNAATRVRARLFAAAGTRQPEAHSLRSCADFQELIPAYLTKSLSPARSLLLVDHTHSCVNCRHALETARSGNLRVLPRPTTVSTRVSPITRWAVAAVVILGVGLGTWAAVRSLLVPAGTRATVQAVNGILYQVADRASTPIFSGRQIGEREAVRTAKGSTAMLRLADGSLVEMNERSELSVSRSVRGTTIHLDRGNVIIQAAKQRNGALYVATADCQVSVKGTVFAVTRGTKGSRVSVVEGQVKVDQGSQSQLLTPGEQTTTNAAVERTAVQDDIAWSRDSARYLALLGEFSVIQKQLANMPGPGVRTSSKLLEYVPWGRNPMLYAAIPNIGSTLAEANRLFEERIQQSPVLKQWWDAQQNGKEGQPGLRDMVQKIKTVSDYVGDEVVLAITGEWDGSNTSPVLLAEVKRPGLREYLDSQFVRAANGRNAARFVDNPESERPQPAATEGRQMLMYLNNDVIAISTDVSQIQGVAEYFKDNGGGRRFNGDSFYDRIHQAYESGATWLFCVNMEQISHNFVRGNRARRENRQAAELTGFNDVRYLILERKDVNGETKNQAELSFRNDRRGLASWLAAPGPMGSLEFVSPDASVAASFVIKNPGALLRELLAEGETMHPELKQHLDQFQNKSGVNIINDLADPLGSDLTFAIDGPLLPTPSWKLAVEVYSPDRLQWAIEHIVNASEQKFTLAKEQAGSRTFYKLTSGDIPYEIDYTFVDSYLLAAPSRNLLTSAIQNRETGYTLSHSTKFRDQLPRDTYANFSGIVYHDLSGAISSVADKLKPVPSLKDSIDILQANSAPGLIYAYGERNRIVVSANGGVFGFNLNSLALPAIIQQAMHKQ